jgi:hypothetical protein
MEGVLASPRELNRGIVFQHEPYLVTQNRDGTIIARNAAGSITFCRCLNCSIFPFGDGSMPLDECLRRTQRLAEVIAATPDAELLRSYVNKQAVLCRFY